MVGWDVSQPMWHSNKRMKELIDGEKKNGQEIDWRKQKRQKGIGICALLYLLMSTNGKQWVVVFKAKFVSVCGGVSPWWWLRQWEWSITWI